MDAPDDFAYAVARSLDRNKGLLKWAVLPFSYDPSRVWKTNGNVPLHPWRCAGYYREVRLHAICTTFEYRRMGNMKCSRFALAQIIAVTCVTGAVMAQSPQGTEWDEQV